MAVCAETAITAITAITAVCVAYLTGMFTAHCRLLWRMNAAAAIGYFRSQQHNALAAAAQLNCKAGLTL